MRSIGSSLDPRDEQRVQMVAEGMRQAKGLESVTVNGVSPKTHFAEVMVEADYRMKLIGIGMEKPPVKLVSFVDRANAAQLGSQGLARWYFTPDYPCVQTRIDGNAMELVGDGVKVVGEEELVGDNGQRSATRRGNTASQAFTQAFTKVYPELAERSPVYAELRNMIDLSVVAAYIQQHDFYSKANWKMDTLGDENAVATEIQQRPDAGADGRERRPQEPQQPCDAQWRRADQPRHGSRARQDHRWRERESRRGPRKGQNRSSQGPLVVGLRSSRMFRLVGSRSYSFITETPRELGRNALPTRGAPSGDLSTCPFTPSLVL